MKGDGSGAQRRGRRKATRLTESAKSIRRRTRSGNENCTRTCRARDSTHGSHHIQAKRARQCGARVKRRRASRRGLPCPCPLKGSPRPVCERCSARCKAMFSRIGRTSVDVTGRAKVSHNQKIRVCGAMLHLNRVEQRASRPHTMRLLTSRDGRRLVLRCLVLGLRSRLGRVTVCDSPARRAC